MTNDRITGIGRIDDDRKRTHAWVVHLQHRKKSFIRCFSDGIHGGKEHFYQAAVDFLRRVGKEHPQGAGYELFKLVRLDDVVMVVANAFAGYEPTSVALGISADELTHFVRLYRPRMIQDGLTIMATDLVTGDLVGALIADDLASGFCKAASTSVKNSSQCWLC